MSIADNEIDELYTIIVRYRSNEIPLPGKDELRSMLNALAAPPRPVAVLAAASRCMTLAQYVGSPRTGRPGQFFRHNSRPGHSTQTTYETACNGLLSSIAHIPMDQLTQDDIESMIWEEWALCETCGRSCLEITECDDHRVSYRWNSLNNTFAQARTMLRAAERHGLISSDPSKLVRLPRALRDAEPPQRTGSRPALTMTELKKLIDAHPPEYRAVAATAYGGLMRIGEVLGLQRGDVTPPARVGDGATVQIQRTVVSAGGTWRVVENSAKTQASLNVVVVPYSLWLVLEAYMSDFRMGDPDVCKRCADDADAEQSDVAGGGKHVGCGLADDAPLFVDRRGGRLLPNVYRESIFRAAVSSAGLDLSRGPVTPHILRASCATHMAEQGVDVHVIAKAGRWVTLPVMLKHYIRSETVLKLTSAATLNAALGPYFQMDYVVPPPENREQRQVRVRLAELQDSLDTREAEVERLRRQVDVLEASLLSLGQGDLAMRRRVECRLRDVSPGARSLDQILVRLNLKSKDSNFDLVQSVAQELGIELPQRRSLKEKHGGQAA